MIIPLEVPVQLSREEAQRRAAEELAKSKYGVEPPGWLKRLWELLQRWLEDLLTTTTTQSGAPSAGGPSWVVPAVVVALLIAIALLVWKVGLPRIDRRKKDADVEVDASMTPKQYRTLADAAADRGDWETALRERFRALIRELEIRTILDARPSRTAMEVVWVGSRVMPGATDDLTQAAVLFSDVAYGERTPTAEDDDRMRRLSEMIVRHADRVDLDDADTEPQMARR